MKLRLPPNKYPGDDTLVRNYIELLLQASCSDLVPGSFPSRPTCIYSVYPNQSGRDLDIQTYTSSYCEACICHSVAVRLFNYCPDILIGTDCLRATHRIKGAAGPSPLYFLTKAEFEALHYEISDALPPRAVEALNLPTP